MSQPQRVVSTTYPFLSVHVELRAHRGELLALLDTGFTGDLTVPAGFPDGGLGSPDGYAPCELADGSIVHVPYYLGTVEIVGLPPSHALVLLLGTQYLLGRGMIDRFRVTFDHGRSVIVEL